MNMNNTENPKFRLSDINLIPSKRVSAGILAAGLAITGVGVGGENEVRAETKNAVSEIVIAGEMPSQQLQIETLETEKTIITPKQVKEAIMNLSTNSVSPEYLGAAKDIFEKWEESTFGPYEERLRKMEGVKEERVPFCARVWYCRNEAKSHADELVKFQDYLGETDIIAYAKGEKNANVICDKEGNPRVWMVVADKKFEKKAIKSFNEAIKWYKENKMPDMLESASENGSCVFFVANTDPDKGSSSAWLNEWGEICLNQNSENTKGIPDKNIRNQYISALVVEPYGIVFKQVTSALDLFAGPAINTGNNEVVKSLVAVYVAEELSGVDKDGYYEGFAEGFLGMAKMFAKNYSRQGVTIDGPLTKRLLELMDEFARIPGFGSLKDVETYNQAMANW